jgi:hypothetical protein
VTGASLTGAGVKSASITGANVSAGTNQSKPGGAGGIVGQIGGALQKLNPFKK